MFGERLIYLRKCKKISQRKLGSLLDLSQSAIAKYERNESEPDISTLKKMSQIFDVSLDYLINEEETITLRKDKYNKLIECSQKMADMQRELMEILKEK